MKQTLAISVTQWDTIVIVFMVRRISSLSTERGSRRHAPAGVDSVSCWEQLLMELFSICSDEQRTIVTIDDSSPAMGKVRWHLATVDE